MSRACWKIINVLYDTLKSIHEREVNDLATKDDKVKADEVKADADAFLNEATFFGIRAQAHAFYAASAEASDDAKVNEEIISSGHNKHDGEPSS